MHTSHQPAKPAFIPQMFQTKTSELTVVTPGLYEIKWFIASAFWADCWGHPGGQVKPAGMLNYIGQIYYLVMLLYIYMCVCVWKPDMLWYLLRRNWSFPWIEGNTERHHGLLEQLRTHSGRATKMTLMMGEGIALSMTVEYARHARSWIKMTWAMAVWLPLTWVSTCWRRGPSNLGCWVRCYSNPNPNQ